MAANSFKRKTMEQTSGRRIQVDPRCWRTIYHVRLMLSHALGFMPSWDYALSEVLVDPARGAKMLTRAKELYGKVACPQQYSPHGNRYRAAVSANRDEDPGDTFEDWGKP